MRYPRNKPNLTMGPTLGETSTAAIHAALKDPPKGATPRFLRALKSEAIRRHCSRRGKARKQWDAIRAFCAQHGQPTPRAF